MQGFLSSFEKIRRFLPFLLSRLECAVFPLFFFRIMNFSSRKIEKIRRPLPFVFLVEIKVYSSGI